MATDLDGSRCDPKEEKDAVEKAMKKAGKEIQIDENKERPRNHQ